MRAAIYVQDSNVREEVDLHDQDEELRRRAAEKGYDVVAVFTDTGPVGDPDRPGMLALREAIRQRSFDAVFALSADHLYDRTETLRDFADECLHADVNIEVPGFVEAVA